MTKGRPSLLQCSRSARPRRSGGNSCPSGIPSALWASVSSGFPCPALVGTGSPILRKSHSGQPVVILFMYNK